jgi:hypothetical protein
MVYVFVFFLFFRTFVHRLLYSLFHFLVFWCFEVVLGYCVGCGFYTGYLYDRFGVISIFWFSCLLVFWGFGLYL